MLRAPRANPEPVRLDDVIPAILDHDCCDLCDRTTHAVRVDHPAEGREYLPELDWAARAAGVILCRIETPSPAGRRPWVIRWSRLTVPGSRFLEVRELAATDWPAAVQLAWDAGLISETQLVGAYLTGADVLAVAGIVEEVERP